MAKTDAIKTATTTEGLMRCDVDEMRCEIKRIASPARGDSFQINVRVCMKRRPNSVVMSWERAGRESVAVQP